MGYELNTPSLTSVIASGAVSGSAVALPGWELIAIDVPALTSSTLQFYVSIDGTTFRKMIDSLGNTIFLIPASTGNFCIAARDAFDLSAYTHVMPVAGSAQSSGAVTITFRFRGS